jgi:hypothetical protein
MAVPNPYVNFSHFIGDDDKQPVDVWLDQFQMLAGAVQPPLNDAVQFAHFVTLCEPTAFAALADGGLAMAANMNALRANCIRVFRPGYNATAAETAFTSARQSKDQPFGAFARLFARLTPFALDPQNLTPRWEPSAFRSSCSGRPRLNLIVR